MSFLIKTGFWLALVLLILPVDREEAGIEHGPSMFESLAAVQTVVTDVRGFCGRNPQTCDTGAATLSVLRQKAVYSAGVVQGWLADSHDPDTLHVRVDDIAPTPEPLVHTSHDASSQEVATLIDASSARIPAQDHPPL